MNETHSNIRRNPHCRDRHACRYPNAASSRYFLDRLADMILCSASGVGIAAILFFIITMR